MIDDIRDLMYDINSPCESVDLINDLMRWSSMHDLHIHTVLHLNKGDDNTCGHIGTELNKYLMGREVIIKKDKAYVYQPEALDNRDNSVPEEVYFNRRVYIW